MIVNSFVYVRMYIMYLFPIIEVRGDWSTRGCILVHETEDDVTCHCDHLTSFSILLVGLYVHNKSH